MPVTEGREGESGDQETSFPTFLLLPVSWALSGLLLESRYRYLGLVQVKKALNLARQSFFGIGVFAKL